MRPARSGDAERIVELADQLGYQLDPAVAVERIEQSAGDPDRAMVVAEFAGRVVGWLEFEARTTFLGGAFAEIEGLVVDRAIRRSGAGRALVAWAEGEAQHRRLDRIRVRSNVKREDPVVFYPAVGFTLTKEARIYDKTLHT